MKIVITNKNNGYKAEFYEHVDFCLNFGYENQLYKNYDTFVNKNKAWRIHSPAGFWGNNAVTPTSTKGVNEDGVNFKANSSGSKIISFNFDPVIVKIRGVVPNISPNNYLNNIVMIKNDTLLVEVYTSAGKHTCEFFVTNSTNTEAGVIVLESSTGGSGALWKLDRVEIKRWWFSYDGQTEPDEKSKAKGLVNEMMPRKMKRKKYPFIEECFSISEAFPIITFGGSKSTGTFSEITFTNRLTGTYFKYTNTDNDDKIIVDTQKLSVTNRNGDDRKKNFEGNFLIMLSGINNIEVKTKSTELTKASEYLPLDFNYEIVYDNFVVGLEEEMEGCDTL